MTFLITFSMLLVMSSVITQYVIEAVKPLLPNGEARERAILYAGAIIGIVSVVVVGESARFMGTWPTEYQLPIQLLIPAYLGAGLIVSRGAAFTHDFLGALNASKKNIRNNNDNSG